jgi:hypothetical protein
VIAFVEREVSLPSTLDSRHECVVRPTGIRPLPSSRPSTQAVERCPAGRPGSPNSGQVPIPEVSEQIQPLLVDGEELFAAFKSMRDYIAFTSQRIIAVNVQGIAGKKKDFTSLPFSRIQAFSIETAGTFDLDAELDLWFSGH